MKAINPATGELIREYETHTREQVEAKLDDAVAAFARWQKTSFEERAQLMRRAAHVLEQNAQHYAELMTTEMGKPIKAARSEVQKCQWACEYFADNAAKFLEPEAIETDASRSFVRYDPLGPVLAIMPWNFPFWQVFRFAAPGLMAGNVGLLKHASNVPGCGLAIEEVFAEAGFPPGVFSTLLIGSSEAEWVMRDARVKAVTLTGSVSAGRAVGKVAGEELMPSVLELGGSDPFIVLADCDLEHTVEGAVTGRTINNGQSCIAAKRFIVEDAIYDAFVERFQQKLAELTVGNPADESTDMGPLARPDLVEDIHDQVRRSVEQGARLVLGGEPLEQPGNYYPPTLLADVEPGMAVFDEETFGPVAAVTRARDVDQAIALANRSTFGLGASLWTGRDDVAELAARIEAGHVAVNGIVKSDPRLPFGGIKDSGYGRELSHFGILEFVNIKTVWIR